MAFRQTTRVLELTFTDKDLIALLKRDAPDDLDVQALPDEAGNVSMEVIDKRIFKLTYKRVGSVRDGN